MKHRRFGWITGRNRVRIGHLCYPASPIRLDRGPFPVQYRPFGPCSPYMLYGLFGGIREVICDTSSQRLSGIP